MRERLNYRFIPFALIAFARSLAWSIDRCKEWKVETRHLSMGTMLFKGQLMIHLVIKPHLHFSFSGRSSWICHVTNYFTVNPSPKLINCFCIERCFHKHSPSSLNSIKCCTIAPSGRRMHTHSLTYTRSSQRGFIVYLLIFNASFKGHWTCWLEIAKKSCKWTFRRLLFTSSKCQRSVDARTREISVRKFVYF